MQYSTVAEAFSSHRFADAEPFLADDVVWQVVGMEPTLGKTAVAALCEASESYLAGITTNFREFRVIDAGTTVVVDSLADYTELTGDVSTVASCDIYDFEEGLVTRVRSYGVELGNFGL